MAAYMQNIPNPDQSPAGTGADEVVLLRGGPRHPAGHPEQRAAPDHGIQSCHSPAGRADVAPGGQVPGRARHLT
eukprot:3753467-Pyramimonas_sp.AAC.1